MEREIVPAASEPELTLLPSPEPAVRASTFFDPAARGLKLFGGRLNDIQTGGHFFEEDGVYFTSRRVISGECDD